MLSRASGSLRSCCHFAPHSPRRLSPSAGRKALGHMAAQLRTLLVYDFDWSLVEENSDTWVIKELGAEAIYRRGRQELGLPWTQLMDHCLLEAAQQLGRTPADVRAALHRLPVHPSLVQLVADAAGGLDGSRAAGSSVTQLILSDANTEYIETILQHHGLRGAFAEVHTNGAEWRDGALRVAPYHSHPHGCRLCPPNLCKGTVLHGFFERQAAAGKTFDRILYVGDGKGDFCPSSLLLHGHRHWHPEAAGAGVDAAPSAVAAPGAGAAADGGAGGSGGAPAPCGNGANIVFARNEYPDGLPCSLFVMLSQAGDAPAGDGGRQAATGQRGVLPWSRPEQLAALLRQELGL